MFERLGSVVSRRYGWVIVAWAAVAGAIVLLAPRLEAVVTSDISAFLTGDAVSIRGGNLLAKTWPQDDFGDSAALIFQRRTGLTPGDRAFMDQTETWLRGSEAPEVVDKTQSARSRPELARVLISRDGTTEIMLVTFTTPPFEPPTNRAVVAIRDHTRRDRPDGLFTSASGNAGVAADQAAAIETSVERTTIVTLALVVLILLWVYRSPVTPLVPLITIGIAFVIAQGLVALLAQAGMQVSSLVQQFMIVIVFGAGTDYCLFVVSRFREEVERHGEYRRTLIGTIALIGAVIASSASTVIVGFTAQGVARFGMFRTTGPAMAISVAVTLAAGLTLTPALMRAFGSRLFWPAKPEQQAAGGTVAKATA